MTPIRLLTILATLFCFAVTVTLLGSAVKASVTNGAQLKDRPEIRAEAALSDMPAVDWISVQNRVLRYKTQKIETWSRPAQEPLATEVNRVAVAPKTAAARQPAACGDAADCKWVDLATVPPRDATSDAQ